MESTLELEMEAANWLNEEPLDVGLNPDPLWNTFRRAMTEPLTRTTAFSFANDVVRKTGKEERWCRKLAPLFRQHLDELRKNGLLDQVTSHPAVPSSYVTMRKNQLLKVILGSARLDIANAELKSDKAEEFSQIILSTVSTLTQLLESSWKVEANGSIARNNVEVHSLTCVLVRSCLNISQLFSWSDFGVVGTRIHVPIGHIQCGPKGQKLSQRRSSSLQPRCLPVLRPYCLGLFSRGCCPGEGILHG
jgi:hypothetical protein